MVTANQLTISTSMVTSDQPKVSTSMVTEDQPTVSPSTVPADQPIVTVHHHYGNEIHFGNCSCIYSWFYNHCSKSAKKGEHIYKQVKLANSESSSNLKDKYLN